MRTGCAKTNPPSPRDIEQRGKQTHLWSGNQGVFGACNLAAAGRRRDPLDAGGSAAPATLLRSGRAITVAVKRENKPTLAWNLKDFSNFESEHPISLR
jgi:hypothetical protein